MEVPFYSPATPKWCILCEEPLHMNSFVFFNYVGGKAVEFFHEECFAKHNPAAAARMR